MIKSIQTLHAGNEAFYSSELVLIKDIEEQEEENEVEELAEKEKQEA